MKKEMKKKRLVILDTHAILHRGYHAMPNFASSKGEPTGALYGLVSMLTRIIGELKPDYIIAALDLPDPTHRHIAYEDYKSHRPKTDDALIVQLERSREVLDAFGIPRYECPGFEADDVIGTIVEEMSEDNKDIDIVIASGDMDMLQLVDDDRVRVFTFKTGLTDTIMYNEELVVERFGFGPKLIPDLKGIMGDTSDNIKGVKGVGEGSALKLIRTYGTVEDIYKALKKKGVEEVAKEAGIQKRFAQLMNDAEEDALFSKKLAEIRRDSPIDFTLPKEEWGNSLSKDKLLDMMAELEFRSLVPRVKAMLQGGSAALKEIDDAENAETDAQWEALVGAIPPEDFARAQIAVWVLDSTITEPSYDDMLRLGKAKDFDVALKNLETEIDERGLTFVYSSIELPLMPVLRQMETKGVKIDRKFLKNLSTEYHTELDKISARIFETAGGTFNINSPKQLGEVLFDKLGLETKKKTATGARSTKESELEKLRDAHPIIADILAHRELNKLLSTYIDSLPNLLDDNDRVHTTFVQTGSATGRLASQNPNLQNIPIKTELGRAIRHAFVADKGMKLVAFDYSQIELRIAAFLSGDEGLAEIFREGRDVHTEVASRVFHVRAEDVTYDQRRSAKVINFGILYGMGVNALREGLGSSRQEAQEFYNQYFEAFPRLAVYLDEVKAQAARDGFVTTHFGRRRYFDGIHSPIPFVRAAAERMAINAPMQGTQADIVKIAMIRIHDWLHANGYGHVQMLLQVHDELVFEIADKDIASCAAKIQEIMEGIIPKEDAKGIPFIAEGKVGPNWGEMEKLKI
ncbi:MAG: polA [Candidatus Adlerbacteria bacterium]|nr:polA [Candidatus Adlerbacteria bacterium]